MLPELIADIPICGYYYFAIEFDCPEISFSIEIDELSIRKEFHNLIIIPIVCESFELFCNQSVTESHPIIKP